MKKKTCREPQALAENVGRSRSLDKDESGNTGGSGEDGRAGKRSSTGSGNRNSRLTVTRLAGLLLVYSQFLRESAVKTYVWLPPAGGLTTGGLGTTVPAGADWVGQGTAMVEYSTEVKTVV